MGTFDFKWECPKCGNINISNAVEAEDYTLTCEKCNAECEVYCNVEITVEGVRDIDDELK